ncbi:hypothetical protein AaE_010861 [Aphanomyces astaci]|uniref:Dynein regulatory complex subunit 7 MORN domain-containing protein n=1 Tax=Aphanomyces astaci TaxID=112090 RepID=A0A6A5A298_APHAT|nr:hypothetical protein AaE_010861 [Aphanomyces astaci]
MDGLVTREEVIHKRTFESFEGRDDFLVGRSVALTEDKDEAKAGAASFVLPGGGSGELVVLKMAEKYDRNDRKDADEVRIASSIVDYVIMDYVIMDCVIMDLVLGAKIQGRSFAFEE